MVGVKGSLHEAFRDVERAAQYVKRHRDYHEGAKQKDIRLRMQQQLEQRERERLAAVQHEAQQPAGGSAAGRQVGRGTATPSNYPTSQNVHKSSGSAGRSPHVTAGDRGGSAAPGKAAENLHAGHPGAGDSVAFAERSFGDSVTSTPHSGTATSTRDMGARATASQPINNLLSQSSTSLHSSQLDPGKHSGGDNEAAPEKHRIYLSLYQQRASSRTTATSMHPYARLIQYFVLVPHRSDTLHDARLSSFHLIIRSRIREEICFHLASAESAEATQSTIVKHYWDP